jgi:dsRNA-specific ribonuclease
MMKLILTPWKSIFFSRVREAGKSIFLISPFMKFNIVSMVYRAAATKQMLVRTITRCKALDFASGVSDIDAIYALSGFDKSVCDFRLRIDNRLHAKIYIFDGEIAYVGSSNITFSGLQSNYEAVVEVTDPIFVQALNHECETYWASALSVSREMLDASVAQVRALARAQYIPKDRDEHFYPLPQVSDAIAEPETPAFMGTVGENTDRPGLHEPSYAVTPRITEPDTSYVEETQCEDESVSAYLDSIVAHLGKAPFVKAGPSALVASIFADFGSLQRAQDQEEFFCKFMERAISQDEFSALRVLGHDVWQLGLSIISIRSGLLRQFGPRGSSEFIGAVGRRHLLDILWDQNLFETPIAQKDATKGRDVKASVSYRLLAAIALEFGLARAVEVIEQFFNPVDLLGEELVDIMDLKDEKTLVQEAAQARGRTATYVDQGREGSDHDPIWSCILKIGGIGQVGGSGPNKTDAEKAAARKALEIMSTDPTWNAVIVELRARSLDIARREGPWLIVPKSKIDHPMTQTVGVTLRTRVDVNVNDQLAFAAFVDRPARVYMKLGFDNRAAAFLGSSAANALIALRGMERSISNLTHLKRSALQQLPKILGVAEIWKMVPGYRDYTQSGQLTVAQALFGIVLTSEGQAEGYKTITALVDRCIEAAGVRPKPEAPGGIAVLESVAQNYIERGTYAETLQRLAQAYGPDVPSYAFVESGPKHLPSFKGVVAWRRFNASAEGKTKREARDKAAFELLNSLRAGLTSGELTEADLAGTRE